MKKLVIGMTLAPREIETYNKSIKSLRDAGVNDTIYIFAEPWEYHIEDTNCKLFINDKKLGCFRNYHEAMLKLLEMDSEYIFITQDDYEYYWDIGNEINDIMRSEELFGYYNFTTRPKKAVAVYKNWWNQLDYRGGWWVCWLLRSDVIATVMLDPLYTNHLLTYTPNKQIDLVVPHIINKLGFPTYYHNPSYSVHVGRTTINHTDRDLFKRMEKPMEPIYWGIASIPNREWELRETVASVLPQVDKLFVYLNGYKEIPEFLKRDNIEVFMWDNSTGDAGKFYKVWDVDGYYITFDDDLVYWRGYVQMLIKKIEKYERKVVVGLHWRIFKEFPIKDFHKDVYVYWYNRETIEDIWCHMLGTGTTGFHTDTIKVKYEDFRLPNMADVWLAKLCHEQDVPMCCIKHTGREIMLMNTADCIYHKTQRDNSVETELCNDSGFEIRYLPQVL